MYTKKISACISTIFEGRNGSLGYFFFSMYQKQKIKINWMPSTFIRLFFY